MATTRREFMRNTGCGMLSAVALVKGLDTLFLTNALAQSTGNDDYKALVCVFLFGGNDANNIVIPYTNYDVPGGYKDIRDNGGTVQLAIPQESLLRISPPSDPGGYEYGLHPALGTGATNNGIYSLWQAGKAAVVVNVGTMIDPNTTKDQLRAGINRPYQLFSHSDQQQTFQTAQAIGPSRQQSWATGWGGRIADRVAASQTFPVVTSIAGVQVFTQGIAKKPLIAGTGRIDQLLTVTRDFAPDPITPGSVEQIVGFDRLDGSATLVKASANISQLAFDTRRQLQTAGDPTPMCGGVPCVFPGTGLGNQLKQVAKLIMTARNFLSGVTRQIFFVSIGGFDTHNNQGTTAGQQNNLWVQVSQAMTSFYQATEALGVADKVTAFTMSDFSRTFKPANPGGGVGTDHAWAGNHFVIGGAVNGEDFYGQYPDLTAIGGPPDYDVGGGSRGRWIPTLSVDQLGAALGRWYGLSSDDVQYVFPNISNFDQQPLAQLMQAPAGGLGKRKVAIVQGT